jgi:hypothetical protein
MEFFEDEAGSDEMDHGGVASVGFVVVRGHAAERLDAAEKLSTAWRQLACGEIARVGVRPIGLGCDNSTGTCFDQLGSASIDFERLLCHHDVTTHAVKQNAPQPDAAEIPRTFRER